MDEARAIVQRLPTDEVENIWRRTLVRHSGSTRPELLRILLHLAPVVNLLGAGSSAAEAVKAVDNAARWFP
jgi:hypothetical protein